MTPSDRESLDDQLVSFRRDLRTADRSPRTLKRCGERVDRVTGWLVDRGREPVLGECAASVNGALLSEILDRVSASLAVTGDTSRDHRAATQAHPRVVAPKPSAPTPAGRSRCSPRVPTT